ncbi:sulfotransferase family 2 domain-containing protein [Chromohalobacter japonicus]|uniref:sulfotransferase family 2 domain-containing protein n=1 Tax=Chromohalobacter japonicus TaxID=223900 RepID=UPI0011779C36|nr:sulfotransferase family 2 domain-containing protein [Chromohalobacter japonicus]
MNYSVLHIGKTGGTAIREALKNVSTEIGGVRVFRHGQTFKKNIKEYPESKVMFGIREPLSWFVSAFNSRAREGRPAYINPHNPLEKIAFDIFSTPNDLAESLSSTDLNVRKLGEFSMHGIFHVDRCLKYYLHSRDFVKKNSNYIEYIWTQETLEEDFYMIKKLLQVDDGSRLPDDDVLRHKTPSSMSTHLSDKAKRNLYNWYSQDYDIYNECLDIRERILESAR